MYIHHLQLKINLLIDYNILIRFNFIDYLYLIKYNNLIKKYKEKAKDMNIQNIAKYLLIAIVVFLVCFIIYVMAVTINAIPKVLETHNPTDNDVETVRDYMQ